MAYILPEKQNNKFWPMPHDYGDLGTKAKKQARWALLSSWYDPDDPETLITNPENFQAAFKFFAECFVKPAPCMNSPRKIFSSDDCGWLPYWLRLMTYPSAAMAGFRGSSKTVWYVHIYPQFVAICRPGTPIMISEYNADRTADELGEIQRQLEENELIHSEFGEMKPKKYGRNRWSSQQLDLMNGSQVRGISINAAHRGRHPMLFINDDVEKDEDSANEAWREDYIENFYFGVVMGMMRPGSHIIWPGTFLNPVSCLLTVVKKLDKRFLNYKTLDCPLIVRRDKCRNCGIYDNISSIDTEILDSCPKCHHAIHRYTPKSKIEELSEQHFGPDAVSMWPDMYTVDDAVKMLEGVGSEDGRIRALGPTKFWTELMNRPELGGDRLFRRTDNSHGYRIIEVDGERKCEVLKTKEIHTYKNWMSTLHITAGADVADSTSSTADYSAIVILGFDPYGYCFLLDAWQGRVRYYETVEKAFDMFEMYHVAMVGWEEAALSSVISHQARMMLEARKASNRHIPIFVPIRHGSTPKPRRMARLEVPMLQGKLLFPVFSRIDDIPQMEHRNRRSIKELITQLDRYTPKGSGTGHDDLSDAYEMAFFVNRGHKPNEPYSEDPREMAIEEIRKMGIPITGASVPMACWTESMWRAARGHAVEKKNPVKKRRRIWS